MNIKKQESDAALPRDEFDRLLNSEVKSTRTSWSEFRRQWKKDRRFMGWGRDDREREKRFREFVKELGESRLCSTLKSVLTFASIEKRAAAQKAEADFFALLKEHGPVQEGTPWKEVGGTTIPATHS
jgi:hypothetical protein